LECGIAYFFRNNHRFQLQKRAAETALPAGAGWAELPENVWQIIISFLSQVRKFINFKRYFNEITQYDVRRCLSVSKRLQLLATRSNHFREIRAGGMFITGHILSGISKLSPQMVDLSWSSVNDQLVCFVFVLIRY